MTVTQISAAGEASLVAEEGEVLRAYRCPAGVWTIGVGLTAGSGVVKPKAGMTITKAESRKLLHAALARNYIPRVIKRGLNRTQHELDGSVSFDFNTGRIHNASWVSAWLTASKAVAERSFKSWNKGGGRVLAGLTKRREREWAIIADARYPRHTTGAPARTGGVEEYQAQLKKLGYAVDVDGIRGAKTIAAVIKFQKDHELTADGIVGPATRAALKRALDAKAAAKTTAGGGAVAGGGTAAAEPSMDALLWAAGIGLTTAALIALAWAVWRYRGPLFAGLPEGVKDFIEDKTGIVVGRRVRT